MNKSSKKTENRLKRKALIKSKTEHKKVKESNRSSVYLSIFILLIMIGSTFGFVMYYYTENNTDSFEYNGFKLKNINNLWKISVSGKTLEFYNHPTQLEDILFSQDIITEILDSNPVVVTFDPESSTTSLDSQYIDQARLDLSVAVNAISAVSEPSDLYSQLQVLTCENKTMSYVENNITQNYELNIIYLKKSNDTKISLTENGCVIIESQDGLGFLELKDRLVYGLYGIMN